MPLLARDFDSERRLGDRVEVLDLRRAVRDRHGRSGGGAEAASASPSRSMSDWARGSSTRPAARAGATSVYERIRGSYADGYCGSSELLSNAAGRSTFHRNVREPSSWLTFSSGGTE